MQSVHCTSDGPWVIEDGRRERGENAYVWQRLIRSGAIVANGTDAPVEDVSPIANFYAAVTRRLPDGTLFYPDERMTREQALRSYTMNCAYAAFEEDTKGSITPGKLADIVVLSKDIMTSRKRRSSTQRWSARYSVEESSISQQLRTNGRFSGGFASVRC